MTDIVLVRPNDKQALYNGIPEGATASDPPFYMALIGGFLRDKGYTVKIIDAEAENQEPSQTANVINEISPNIVGIIPVGSNVGAATWKMHGAGVLAQEIKNSNSEQLIFMWGYHPSALPERTLREESIDYVVVGEGFDTMAAMLSMLADGQKPKGLEGLHRVDGNGKYSGSCLPNLIQNLDELPYTGWELFDTYKYRNHMHFAFEDLSKRDRYGVVMTSLGCPYACSYCAIRYFSGDKRVRYKSPQKAADEIEYLVKKFNVYYIRIIDECFTTNKKHLIEVCDAIIERGLDISIWAYARIDHIDQYILDRMYKAGVRWLGIGIESGSKAIRETVYKGQYDGGDIREKIKMIRDAGIFVCDNYMFGLPGDNIETMKETLALAREINCGYPNMYCTMAYPGSELYRKYLNENPSALPDSWLGYAQMSYETKPLPTEFLTSEEVLRFRDYAFNAFFKNNESYFEMIKSNFGQPAVDAINNMLTGHIKRKLLGE